MFANADPGKGRDRNSLASQLAPQDAILIQAGVTAITIGQDLLDKQAKAYLANPTAGILAQLQAQAVTFQQNVNAAVLTALKITNSDSQKRIIAQIQVVLTGATAVLALLQTIKGSSLTIPTTTITTSTILPYLNEQRSVDLVAQHDGVPEFVASYRVHQAERSLQAAGL